MPRPLPNPPERSNALGPVPEFRRTPSGEYEYSENGVVHYTAESVGVVYDAERCKVHHAGPGPEANIWRKREIQKHQRASLIPPSLQICIRNDWIPDDLTRIVSGPHVTDIINRIQKLEDRTFPEPVTVGVIGTAGRLEDGPKLSREVYALMYRDCLTRIQQLGREPARIRLVSGGAAWADHLAVSLFHAGAANALHLYIPAAWAGGIQGYAETSGKHKFRCPGRSANRWHRAFSKAMGKNSFASIERAKQQGAKLETAGGFKARNTRIAEEAEFLVAYTFGDTTREPKEGGTYDTWHKTAIAERHHIPISSLGTNEPGYVIGG